MADESHLARHPVLRLLVEFLFNPIWVSQGASDWCEDDLEEMKQRLENGCNLILFPEVTRANPGEIAPFNNGIGRLAAGMSPLPILPVFLSGTERVLPEASALPLPFWSNVVVGPPLQRRGTHEDMTHSLESMLRELSRSPSAGGHQQRPREEPPALSIAFLGIDGSGKSTLSKRVAEFLSADGGACLISDGLEFYEQGEPKQIQPLLTEELRRFISRRAKKAKSLKSYKIPKLTELLLRNHLHYEAQRWYLPRFLVLDGSPLLNLIAWSVLYKGGLVDQEACGKAIAVLTGKGQSVQAGDPIFDQFPELSALRRLPVKQLVLPDVVLFLDVTPAEACRRIEARGEHQQVHETEDKLTKLREAYLMVCDVISREFGTPARVVNGERNRERVTAEALRFVESCRNDGKREGKEEA
jgi:thymidylate kinase